MKHKTTQQQPKVRSHVARAAWSQTGGGTHGGDVRQNNKRDRKAAKLSSKGGNYD